MNESEPISSYLFMASQAISSGQTSERGANWIMSKATSPWLLNVIWNNFHRADWIRLLLLTAWIRIGLDAHTESTLTVD